MKSFLSLTVSILMLISNSLYAQSTAPANSTLFKNVHIFDGKSNTLLKNYYVLVKNNTIEKVSSSEPVINSQDLVTVIDGNGYILMPGLIDAHWHTMFVASPAANVIYGDPNLITLVAAKEANATLMRGFTSVRDMAGNSFGLKDAIDQGLNNGPRIWPSGAIISQTGGHGDFRLPTELPSTPGGKLPMFVAAGHSALADGPSEVLKRSREQLMRGASQLKLGAGGGIISKYDPIDVSQYSLDEIKAAVSAADAWNTYVTVHAYTSKAIQTAIKAGVKCIDHGHLMNEETAQLMSEKGTWLSAQPFVVDPNSPLSPEQLAKERIVTEGTDRLYSLAKKYHLKTAFGTDILFESKKGGADQNKMLVQMTRWYTPAETLKMATADNAQLLALSGPRSPYSGKLGVIEEGALADILVIKGNPLDDMHLLEDPKNNLVVIMKDGKIYKNNL